MSEPEDRPEGIQFRASESLGELAAALASAQAKFPAISKDRTARVESRKGEGSSYSYNYADLADVLTAVRPHLAEAGLAIIQPIAWNGAPWLITRLIHSSGQWVESMYKLAEYDRPQDMGSAITYARRYAITSLLGIAAEEDDDGARAQQGPQASRRAGRPKMPACPGCKKPDRVMVSKFGPGYYCNECSEAFIVRDPDDAGAVEPDEVLTSVGAVKPGSGARAAEADAKPNPAYEGERPVRSQPKPSAPAAERKREGDCPTCTGPLFKAKYPRPGAELFCSTCKQPHPRR